MQESTRKFKVTADLTDASVGTIEVPLNIENLPSGLTAVATPQKITVKVGKKVKRDGMIVVPQVDQSQIDPKLQLDSVTVSNERVSVTTDQETLAKIDKVIALLPTSERITGNYSGSVPLQAIDRNGVVLPGSYYSVRHNNEGDYKTSITKFKHKQFVGDVFVNESN